MRRRRSRISPSNGCRTNRCRDIWYTAPAFNAYRGTDWMAEPCQSCERKTIDFGGCRCQAMAVLGDASATDPVCVKSPHHAKMQALAAEFAGGDADALTWRQGPG